MSVEQLIESALCGAVQAHQGKGLWVLDEHPLAVPVKQPAGLQLLTNRYDVYLRFAQAGWSITFNDWDFAALSEPSFDRIYYRISKEKAVVHHVINQASGRLGTMGQLHLFGAKNEGFKGYVDRASVLFVDVASRKLGKGGFAAVLYSPRGTDGGLLDAKDYTRLRSIFQLDGHEVLSKPGVFGWEKQDAGSVLLADSWQDSVAVKQAQHVLDLGCGYGYLSLRFWSGLSATERQGMELTATDSNAAAIRCCEENFQRWGINGQVIAADCASEIHQRFDLIICNPPFHQGFAVEGELTDRFLAATARLLSAGGQAFFVVNRFVPLARKAEQAGFSQVETYADEGSFKLIRIAKG